MSSSKKTRHTPYLPGSLTASSKLTSKVHSGMQVSITPLALQHAVEEKSGEKTLAISLKMFHNHHDIIIHRHRPRNSLIWTMTHSLCILLAFHPLWCWLCPFVWISNNSNNNKGYFQMPILKSSKHFTRSWRRWGDRVTKLLHKCFSQTLHYYTSIHQCTVTSVAHTLSPSLSPPLNPHTYTPHATHTLTQSKSGKYELIRFLGVKAIGF